MITGVNPQQFNAELGQTGCRQRSRHTVLAEAVMFMEILAIEYKVKIVDTGLNILYTHVEEGWNCLE
jgi:hypothetical protein